MADNDKVVVVAPEKVEAEEAEFRAELEADGELLDDSGKPLPWNHPKRIRRLYKEAKTSRKDSSVLKELGVKSADLPAILAEYNDFKEAYAEWQEQKAKGKTTEDEDDEAKATRIQAEKFKKVLDGMGVQFKDPEAETKKSSAAEERKQQVIGAAYDRMTELVEDAGYDLDKMEPKERNKFLKHVDFLVGEELEENEDDRKAFMRGSLRPIEKHTKKVLESLGITKAIVKGTGIKNLPPRVGSGPPGSREKKVEHKDAKDLRVKDSIDEMVEALKAQRLKKQAEE
jgi:hypothetical protein